MSDWTLPMLTWGGGAPLLAWVRWSYAIISLCQYSHSLLMLSIFCLFKLIFAKLISILFFTILAFEVVTVSMSAWTLLMLLVTFLFALKVQVFE